MEKKELKKLVFEKKTIMELNQKTLSSINKIGVDTLVFNETFPTTSVTFATNKNED